jgi:histo-blood group ABO system transferase
MKSVGLLLIATNKYISFLQPLIESADNFFMKDYDVTYFIFTNEDLDITTNRKFVKIDVEHKPWPWMTLGRYKIFSDSHDILNKMDYLYYADVDMLFVSDVGEEILGDRVGTQHPCFVDLIPVFKKRGTPETNPRSLACVYDHEPMQYFAGGFNGGTSEEYLKMASSISKNIEIDLENDIIAIWHDESHLNRYFINNQPTTVLSPSYCYGENFNIPYEKKILALAKDHNFYQK